MALGNGHVDVAVFLLQNGWEGGADYAGALRRAVGQRRAREDRAGEQGDTPGSSGRVRRSGAHEESRAHPDPESCARCAAGRTRSPRVRGGSGDARTLRRNLPGGRRWNDDDGELPRRGRSPRKCRDNRLFVSPHRQPGCFACRRSNATLTFNERGGLVESIQLVQGPATIVLARDRAGGSQRSAHRTVTSRTCRTCRTRCTYRTCCTQRTRAAPRNWPSFRGEAGSGNGMANALSPSGTSRAGRTSSGRRRYPASPTRAPSRGAIASSSRRPSAKRAIRAFEPGCMAT